LNQLNIDKNFKNIFGSYNFRYDQTRQKFIWTFYDSNISSQNQTKMKEPKREKKKWLKQLLYPD